LQHYLFWLEFLKMPNVVAAEVSCVDCLFAAVVVVVVAAVITVVVAVVAIVFVVQLRNCLVA